MGEQNRKETTLKKLRERARCSEETVARTITGSRAGVGAFEARTNIETAMLRRYAEMLKGTLHVVIRMPDGEEFLITPFSSGIR